MKAAFTARRIALALAVSLACGAALAHAGPGGPGAMRGPAGHSAERMESHLTQLRTALNLQPQQQAAWSAFEGVLKRNQEARLKMYESMAAQRGNADAMAEQRVAMMKLNAQAAEEALGARKALAATLTAEQKAVLDRHGPGAGPRAMRGETGHGGSHRRCAA